MTATLNSPGANETALPHTSVAPGVTTDDGHEFCEAHMMTAVVSPPANESTTTPSSGDVNSHTQAGTKLGSSQGARDTQLLFATAALPAADQGRTETHVWPVGGVLPPPAPASQASSTKLHPPVLVDPLLILAAQALDDMESTRIANENRLRSLRDVYGLAGTTQEAEAAGLVEGLAKLEHQAELSLKRALRRHPLGSWVKRTHGIGEKQGARLLAAISDPYWNSLHDRPRTVSELWAYCGYHVLRVGGDAGHCPPGTQSTSAGVAPARARGQRSNWSAEAKMRVWLVACSCIKQADSPYRAVYDLAREKYESSRHEVECKRCGPSGHPAQVGTPISAGHQHARALRLVSKAVLKDLWIEAKSLHEG